MQAEKSCSTDHDEYGWGCKWMGDLGKEDEAIICKLLNNQASYGPDLPSQKNVDIGPISNTAGDIWAVSTFHWYARTGEDIHCVYADCLI